MDQLPLYLKTADQLTQIQPMLKFELPLSIRTKPYYLISNKYIHETLSLHNLRYNANFSSLKNRLFK